MHPLIPYFEPLKFTLWGNVAIHGFGILVAAGIILGGRLGQWKAEQDGLQGELINRFLGWIVVGIFVGGHLGHALFYQPEHYLENPWELLKFWDGLSSYGGFIGCVVLGILFFRNEDKRVRDENRRRVGGGEPRLPRIDVWAYADALLVGFTLGWFFGRLGCFSAHDHPGTVTNFWLGVYGMCRDQPRTVACHDMGLYEAIFSGLQCLLFLALNKRPRFPGFFVGLWLAMYGPLRFGMDFFRTSDVDSRYFGLTPAQYGAAVMTVAGIAILVARRNVPPVRVQDQDPTPEPEPG